MFPAQRYFLELVSAGACPEREDPKKGEQGKDICSPKDVLCAFLIKFPKLFMKGMCVCVWGGGGGGGREPGLRRPFP